MTRNQQLGEDPTERIVAEGDGGQRLDAFLAAQFPLYSRVHLRRVITAGGVRVDGARTKPSYRLLAGQQVTVWLPEIPRDSPEPENIPLEIIYEDDGLIAVNKPAGMVVHPAKGHWSGTLTAALAYHFEALSTIGGPTRPGIVHRLDRDTSGVMVVAKDDQVHLQLAKQFEMRTTEKQYLAIVVGSPNCDRDWINEPIGAHPYHRERKAIRAEHHTSRQASTFYEVQERFRGFALLRLQPKTGRTHQIRLHVAHIGCPVLCDRLYGGRSEITRGEVCHSIDAAILLSRQALHATTLKIQHPLTGESLQFEAPPPPDFQDALDSLRKYRAT